MIEEKEVDLRGTTTCGVFLPIPYDIAKDFPAKPEDNSVPHITVLFAGDLSPADFGKFSKIVRNVCTCVKPFEVSLHRYGEFNNKEGAKVAHMSPDCNGVARLATIHGMLRKAFEDTGIKIDHYYGTERRKNVPYEVRYRPHATLAYLRKDENYNGPKPTGSWRVNELEVWGHEKIRVPLGCNTYDQPVGLTRTPINIHYPMSVPDVHESEELTELRDSCLDCVRKHLGQAAALMDEVKQGHPLHRWLVAGHLGEAASEAIKEYPKLAQEIRDHRLRYMKNPNYDIPIMDLIAKAERLVSEERAVRSGAVAISLRRPFHDRLKGGKADKNRPEDFDPRELAMGVKVEREHTKNPALALEIAMDHLKEIPDYYTRLAKMEKSAGVKHESVTSFGGGIGPDDQLLDRFTWKKLRGKLTRNPLGID